MLATNVIPLGALVSFEMHPALLIAGQYTRAKVEGILNYADANKYIDAMARHINVYPTLPPGVPNNPESYYYVKLRLTSGEVDVIGIPWIKDETFTVVTTTTMRFSIVIVAPEDETIIRAQLGALGYSLVDVVFSGP